LSRFVANDQAARVERLSVALAESGRSLLELFLSPEETNRLARAGFHVAPTDSRVPVRNPVVKGPLAPDGDWVVEKAGRTTGPIAVSRLARSGDVTYEIVNFVDGTRTISEIRDAVSAEFEPVELSAVAEYLDLLVKAGAMTYK